MRFAICNETFQDWPWDRALDLTLECGYTGWEIAPFTIGGRVDQLPVSRREQMRGQIERAGVQVIGLHWLLAKTEGFHLTTPDESIRQRTADYLGHLAELCRDLGGDVMVLGSPQQRNFPAEMTHAQAADNALWVLERLAPKLEACHVTLAVEPLGPSEGNFLNHAADAVALIERLASPWVRLHLDVKAMSSEGEPIDQIILRNAHHLAHFHANDPNKLGPGMGDTDFEPIFAALRAAKYDGWVSVEVFDYTPGIETLARESMQNMRSVLRKLDGHAER
jgi:sugar phosphate isomerase/epimerase